MTALERTITATQSSRVVIKIAAGSDAVTRITGPGGDEWREHLYNLRTEDDVFEHWSYNATANGVTDACELDGWADLDAGEVTFTVVPLEFEAGV